MQLGKPDDIKATVGTPCAYSLREQLFPQEWQALQDLKTNYEICKNYSDEFLMACLFARKLDLIRTHNLLQQNMRWRKENGFLTIPKLSEINQEVFSMWGYVPGARSKEGTGILYFHLVEMGKEPFTANNIIKFLVWHNFVGGFSEGMDFYRNGVFILRDMGQFTWKHVDVDIMKKVNTMWTDNFPTRVKKFIALDPPAIFEALKKIARTFMKKKMTDRFTTDSRKSIGKLVDKDQLIESFGGNLPHSAAQQYETLKEWAKVNEERLISASTVQ